MKTNAIIRIIVWSMVIILLTGILFAGILPREPKATETSLSATVPPTEFVNDSSIPWDITDTCDEKATVNATAVNVRAEPSSSSAVVGMVEKGDVLSINRGIAIGDPGEYWLGIYAPVEGWIKAEYVDSYEDVIFFSSNELRNWSDSNEQTQSEGDSVTISDSLTVYAIPDNKGNDIATLAPGDTVIITRQETVNNEVWAYITNPVSGWINMEFLSTETLQPDVSGQGYHFDSRNIREIDIEWAAGQIIIEPAEVDTIQVSEAIIEATTHTMVCKQNNDKLVIRYSEHDIVDLSFGLSLADVKAKVLTILVPMGWMCDSLEVDAASAMVDVKNLSIGEVDFDGASGTCNFVNCKVTKLDLDTASGDIYFSGSLDNLDCDAASASVYAIFDQVPSRVDMDSMSGDLDITLPANAGFTINIDSLTCDFYSDFDCTERNGIYRRGDGKCQITMNAVSGDIYLRNCTEADAAVDHHTEDFTTIPDNAPDNTTDQTESHYN